jgi:hypothetical protein
VSAQQREGVDVVATFQPTGEQLAAAFWNMDAYQQADFFAELERLAGVKLCFQMVGVSQVIAERAETGDWTALNGFQTMLAHAEDYVRSAAEHRAFSARHEIKRMADDARRACGVQP